MFWWPFLGAADVLGGGEVNEFTRPLSVRLIMELIGAGVLAVFVHRLDLLGEGRELFTSKGQLLRSRLED